MSDITLGTGGDAVSKMLQVIAKDLKVAGIKWIGKGPEDCRQLLVEIYNVRLLKDALWIGMRELLAMKEMTELPEPLQAKIAAIVLNARAQFELQIKYPQQVPPQMSPPLGGAG